MFTPRKYYYTSSERTLYMCIVESSMPIAIILLSAGWKARYVAAGGGDPKAVIVWNYPTNKLVKSLETMCNQTYGKELIIFFEKLP